jgi:3-hydroxybutyryl-CoA dehydrogenase
LLKKEVSKSRMTNEVAHDMKGRFSSTGKIGDFKNVDFVVEAVSESPQLKHQLFSSLDTICRPDVILASNTSSISITKIAASTKRPESVVGMHFMNPVPVMKLVEVISGIATDESTLNTTRALAGEMGKVCTTSTDYPGFIANRILMPYINEAAYALMEGVGTKEDIDTTMKLGTNVPMGPLTLADFIGLDTCVAILRVLQDGLGSDKYGTFPFISQQRI